MLGIDFRIDNKGKTVKTQYYGTKRTRLNFKMEDFKISVTCNLLGDMRVAKQVVQLLFTLTYGHRLIRD